MPRTPWRIATPRPILPIRAFPTRPSPLDAGPGRRHDRDPRMEVPLPIMTRPLHLLAVWNPAYSGDALDVHLSLLLEWSRRRGAGQAEADDVYVWWGKIRSKNREGRLKHHDQVTALDTQAQAGTGTPSPRVDSGPSGPPRSEAIRSG